MATATRRVAGIDWVEHWRRLVADRELASHGHSDPRYWDRRAPCFARSTAGRADQFLEVLEPYVSPRKTLIDVGAGAGRHAVPLAERLEWVTVVEPSEGMRAHIPGLTNMTLVASAWEDAEVAGADLVICSHVMYGVAEAVPFIEKMERSARERVFIMLREGQVPHLANVLRERMARGPTPPTPQFSDLFMLLVQIGITADVRFISYPVISRYNGIDEALADCRPLFGDDWDEEAMRGLLADVLVRDGVELVFDGGVSISGVAHWQPRES